MTFPQSDFWDFSVNLYGADGVHDACVTLQTEYGLDINLVFYGLWHAAVGAGRISSEKWREIFDTFGGWHNYIVRPVWQARQKLKPAFADFPTNLTEPLRQMYVSAELAAEHIEQVMLGERFAVAPNEAPTLEQRHADATANIEGYAAQIGVKAGFDNEIDLFLRAIDW